MKRSSAEFLDYTNVVIDLTNSMKRANLSLGDLSGEGMMCGIEAIKDAALAFIDEDIDIGFQWDGEWVEAVEDYAFEVSKAWANSDYVIDDCDSYRAIANKIINSLVANRGGLGYVND